jgi:phosphate transport system permease protein
MFLKEYFWRYFVAGAGFLVIALVLAIAGFLLVKGLATFTVYKHSLVEFLFSSDFSPVDSLSGGGAVGSAIFICGTLLVSALALLLATPFSLATAVFMSEISPKIGERLMRPAVEMFVGIPSVVYGWTALNLLVPLVKNAFGLVHGFTVLTGALVLAVMISPTITTVAADAIKSIPKALKDAAFGLGCTRWQTIRFVVIPAASPGIFTGIILGLARAFGEALAISMVIGDAQVFPQNVLFGSTSTLTTVIASNMGNAAEGGELQSALWTMAALLFAISFLCILAIHLISDHWQKKIYGKN